MRILPTFAAGRRSGSPRDRVVDRRLWPPTMTRMGFKDLAKRLTSSVRELDQTRLQSRYEGVGLTSIADAPLREPIRLGGEVVAMQVVPRAGSPSMEITISDGTARATAVFTGRRRIGGMDPGRGVLFEGVGRLEQGRIVLVNPTYTLLPH